MHYRRGKTRVIFTENFALYLGDYAVTGEEQQERRKKEKKFDLRQSPSRLDLRWTYDLSLSYTLYYILYYIPCIKICTNSLAF